MNIRLLKTSKNHTKELDLIRHLSSLLFLFLLFSTTAFSQISVVKFEKTNYQYARTDKRQDVNNRDCAMLIIETSLQNLSFSLSGGQEMCCDPIYETGQIKLYIPPQVSRITIAHSIAGVLRDYNFPEQIEPLKTYIMVLKHATITTVVEEVLTHNYVEITVSPADALVYLDDKLQVTVDGVLTDRLEIGKKYNLRVEAPLYHAHTEEIQSSLETTVYKTIKLSPAFGTLVITSTPENGAQVVIDGTPVGKTPYTNNKIASGTHQVQVIKEMFQASVTQSVTVKDGETENVTINMQPNFAEPVFKVDNNAEIWINDEMKGKGSWSGRLMTGNYLIETRLPSYRAAKKSINFVAGDKKEIILDPPTPIYGKLDISTTPSGATIFLNDKEYGKTPKIDAKVLIGEYSIRLSKSGYEEKEKTIKVEEGQMIIVSETLEKIKQSAIVNATSSGNANTTNVKIDEVTSVKTFTVNGVTFDMMPVQGGTFTMGCTSEQGSDCCGSEKPSHRVTVSSFYIGKYEVTQKLWEAVMGNNPSGFKGGNLPVEKVSWNDCQEFIRKLNSKTGKTFRLPTEAEWEYAARGGNKSNGYKYSGSNTLRDVAWFGQWNGNTYDNGNSGEKTHSVGSKSPNELGIYDMSGNVYEWCQDWYGDYSSGSQTNPTGPSSGSSRVLRGGSWFNYARYCRVSNRNYDYPDCRYFNDGFRLILVQ
ncbi:MAG: SUMF1/EgtB/PvdO family nonheme iron enzyme [Bacteroidales bacterium]|nr:SUMF1/EgtB/PvdO family nonheme iron enzyme [Bacteroidales bacterium]MDD2204516.1 SUMF1/EgtB/PvdO family nonheme iron enzyme [Bacteroidales bacterium]MDD3914630.1 SUMF1/EgtB/PvdO family nonheme iron enzyme [Bacteroidales bacterium]MDD4633801.1 SUMF1/EgtB/PvdO family nonheme iron enzyme [Bacteroidales bacterium]